MLTCFLGDSINDVRGDLAKFPLGTGPDPSGRERMGLGNNLGCSEVSCWIPRFLDSLFTSSTRLVRYCSNFQNVYVLPYIRYPSLVELKRWLADVAFFPSSTQTPALKTLKSSRGQKGLGFRLSVTYIHSCCYVTCTCRASLYQALPAKEGVG